MKLIDDFLPKYDFAEVHEIQVQAPIEVTYQKVLDLDLSRSRIIRGLFKLREMPAFFSSRNRDREKLGLTFEGLEKSGFILLGKNPSEEIILGLVGRFWTPSGGIRPLDIDGFRKFTEPGFAKTVWNFYLSEKENQTVLSTETRIACMDDRSRRNFKIYWTFIRPFSGIIRQEILKVVRRETEFKAVI